MVAAGDPANRTHADWISRDQAVVWHGFTQMATYADNAPIVVDRGVGNHLYDTDGNRYLDAISSLWVLTLGHADPDLNAAAKDQLDRISHSTLLGNGNAATIEFTEQLLQVVPIDHAHVLYASDGAAAVEQALKIAFQFWHNQGVEGRTTYLALGDAYHGDSVGSLSVGAGGFGTDLFDPLRFPVVRTPGYADADWVDVAISVMDREADRLAAVVIEPLVQGAAGMQVASPSEVRRFAKAVQRRGLVLICDEVATGFGRTGELFASGLCGITPDILCLGKGITGGYLPLSATVVGERIYQAFLGEDLGPRTLYHGHSYSGNALACRVAQRHLELIEERAVLSHVRSMAAQLERRLVKVAEHPTVGAVRQQGLMVGVELAPPAGASRWGRKVCAAAVERGVLLRPLGDVVVLMPPLSITSDEVDEIIDVLLQALDAVAA